MNFKAMIDTLTLARIQQGLSLQKVADELLINKVTIHFWEQHKYKPRFDQFLEWAQFLKVDLNELINDSNL